MLCLIRWHSGTRHAALRVASRTSDKARQQTPPEVREELCSHYSTNSLGTYSTDLLIQVLEQAFPSPGFQQLIPFAWQENSRAGKKREKKKYLVNKDLRVAKRAATTRHPRSRTPLAPSPQSLPRARRTCAILGPMNPEKTPSISASIVQPVITSITRPRVRYCSYSLCRLPVYVLARIREIAQGSFQWTRHLAGLPACRLRILFVNNTGGLLSLASIIIIVSLLLLVED